MRHSITSTMKVTDARQQFSELINRVFKERRRVMIEKQGIPVAALISAQDLERLNQLEAERAERFGALERTGELFKDVPAVELEREVARAIAKTRTKPARKTRRGRAG